MSVLGPGSGALPAGSGGAGGSGPAPEVPGPIDYIVDQALNPLGSGVTGQFLGFTETVEEEDLNLQIYLFLIELIRTEDANNGNLFLKRFLEGPQAVWEEIQDKIFSIKNLWSITDIQDEHLKYLKNIVGWTSDHDHITNELSYDELRRLIANSVSLWKNRGAESTIISMLTLMTGARMRSWNWFDFRWILEETGFGHESDGNDPWLISIDNDREINIRIMDENETLKRYVVENLVKLMRPCGERFSINYLLLLDLFNVDDDTTQWDSLNSNDDTDILTVVDGEGILNDDTYLEEAYSNIENSDSWSNYMFSAKICGTSPFGVTFYRADENNYYCFRFKISGMAKNLELVKIAGGLETSIATTYIPESFVVDPDLYYMFRVSITEEGSDNRIKCYIDGLEVLDATDNHFSSGHVGIIHEVDGAIKINEIEVSALPVEDAFIDINS
jgi:phage tail-like protein